MTNKNKVEWKEKSSKADNYTETFCPSLITAALTLDRGREAAVG